MAAEQTNSSLMRGRLTQYVEAFARHRYATWILAFIAFADSSFLPVMPDVLLVPMALARPNDVWRLSAVCTVASSLGAALGYVIGYELWTLIGEPLVAFYGYGAAFATYHRLVEDWGVWIVIGKAFTPIPFKIMAIAAGVAQMNPLAFIVAAVLGRALHFVMVAALIVLLRERMLGLFTKYERPAIVLSVLVLIAVAAYLYFR
jgi:membrane protein YqaA with SNARE-associated domain